jgi:hypothetical protein
MDAPELNPSRDPANQHGFRFSLRTLLISTAVFALVIKTEGFGLIGFHYPRWIENEPLNNPIKVVRTSQSGLHLADGRIVALSCQSSDLNDALKESCNLIELDTADDTGGAMIYAKRPFTKCGTPWARRLVNFHWFPDDVPSFYRYPLDRATVTHLVK